MRKGLVYLLRRLQSGRAQPFAHVRAGFRLSGSADQFVTYSARREQFGFGSQSLCLLGKALLK